MTKVANIPSEFAGMIKNDDLRSFGTKLFETQATKKATNAIAEGAWRDGLSPESARSAMYAWADVRRRMRP